MTAFETPALHDSFPKLAPPAYHKATQSLNINGGSKEGSQ